MKTKVSKLVTFLLFIIISSVFSFDIGGHIINTLYTVSGIMFSIGLGLVVMFNPYGVRNKNITKLIKNDVNKVRNSYISLFSISTFCILLDNILSKRIISIKLIKSFSLEFNFPLFSVLVLLFSISYYVVNFVALQKLSNDIFDETNK